MGHWGDNILGGLIGWYWEHDKVAAAACMATCGAVVNSYSHRSAPPHSTVWCGGAVVGLITTTLLLARPVSSSAVTVPFPLKTIVSSAQELHYWTSVDRDVIKWSRIMEQINIVWIVIIVCIHCPLSMCPIFFIHPPTIWGRSIYWYRKQTWMFYMNYVKQTVKQRKGNLYFGAPWRPWP